MNDHNRKPRWLRSIFLNEQEKIDTILEFMEGIESKNRTTTLALLNQIIGKIENSKKSRKAQLKFEYQKCGHGSQRTECQCGVNEGLDKAKLILITAMKGVDEVKESVNFMQVGNGHCFICHKETAPNDIHKQCFNKPITYCSNTCDKKWSKHNPLNKSVTEDTEWEKEFYKRFNADYAESGRDETMEDAIDFIKNLLSKARQEGQQEERQFILNILDGIDEADRQMQNEGGGTKAIRMALNVRIIN